MFKSIHKAKFSFVQSIRFVQHASTEANVIQNDRSVFENKRRSFDFSFEYQQLRSIYPSIVEEVINEQLFYHKNFPYLKERYVKLLNYTCFVDDKFLATAAFFIHTYKAFEPNLTEENLKKSCILGWCLRFLESTMIIADDIIDNSVIRYHKPTWYKLPDVGIKRAICDASFIETSVSYLLLNHLSSHPQYFNIQRELLLNYSATMIALYLDTIKFRPCEIENNQNFIRAYPFTVPLVLTAMYLANIDNPRLHTVARQFLIDIAEYLATEDDVECVYSIKKQKDCSDAAEGKSTWLAAQAYKTGTEAHRKILEKHYGVDNEKSLKEIKKIYDELDLKQKFELYKVEFYNDTYKKIDELPKELPGQLFLDILDFAFVGGFRS